MPQRLLSIDIGNTVSKAAVYEGYARCAYASGEELVPELLSEWKGRFGLEHAVISSVADEARFPTGSLSRLFTLHYAKQMRNLPIRVAYRTPETLGTDRLACMVAAAHLCPGKPVLVLQCGTCLTSDFLTADSLYAGGGISPGLRMRFRALNEHTARLPLVPPDADAALYGQTTEKAIQSGVWQGYLSECEGLVQKYSSIYEELNVIITGGDAVWVKDKLKMTIFAFPDLVLFGLMLMLKYDIEKQ